MTNRDIKKIIRQLKKHELSIMDVPEAVKYHKDIVAAERKFGLRKEGNRGFDVVHELFFVEEELLYDDFMGEVKSCNQRLTFDTIEEYYEYLDGDIYDCACYRFCDINQFGDFIVTKNIDVNRLRERETFLSETVDDIVLDISNEEIEAYDEVEKNKKLVKKWIKKFNDCTSGSELEAAVEKYNKSKLKGTVDVSFFFYCYIFQDVNSQERFNAIMEYMCTGRYPEYKMINALCSIYGVENVVEKYDYAGGARQTNYKHKRKLKEYVALLTSGQIHFKSRYYFDKSSHYYCQEVEGFEDERGRPTVSYQRYFETFDEFVQYKGRSLKETDLSGAIKLNVDLSLYETDETTKLPISSSENLVCEIKKEYYNGLFVVSKEWKTQTGSSIKKKTFSTHYFFDFVYYLNGDLSDAFLLFCDGLNNIQDYDNINFYGARMKNDLCEKFGVAYEFCELNTSVIGSFAIIEKNEEETSIVPLVDNTDIVTDDTDMHSVSLLDDYDRNDQRIHYITDLHLMHRLQNANCKSKDDIRYVLQNVVDNIVEDAGSLLLIGGDVSSDFAVFEIFVRLLNRKIKQKRYGHTDVIFVLGNHELWEFPGKNIDEIVSIYRGIIEENGMYLLHNELLYRNVDDKLCKISYEELISLSTKDVRAQIQSTRIVIFGGIGFSGYNQEFNAEQGVYRATLDRAGEIAESIKFEKLYNQILPAIYDKNSVIFTHTPKKDWAANDKLCTNLVEIYVNYLKLIGGDKDNPLVLVRRKDEVGVLPKEYLSTDIYKASREIKKMQKLTSNILSSWYENTTQKKVGK